MAIALPIRERGAGRRLGASPIKQLWLMQSDGTEARQLTDDPEYAHGWSAWSPDGLSIAYQRVSLVEPGARAEVWLLDVESGERHAVAQPGSRPAWIP